MATIHLLLLSNFFIFCSCSFFEPRSKLSNISTIIPLKIQQIPSSPLNPPKMLSFHQNVSLTITLTVGSPPQPVTMVLDTGSELSWLHCRKTPNTSSYDPLHSTSYTPVPCSSPICMTRTRDFTVPASCDPKKLCHATLSYADATSVDGNLAADTFRFGSGSGSGSGSDPGSVIFGCMDVDSSSNEDGLTTGLMGMNRGSLSFVTQMGYPKFGYCISGLDSNGVLVLGDYNLTWLTVLPLAYTPMVKMTTPLPYFDRVAYTVQLEGFKVGKTVLPLPKSVYEPDHTGAGQTMVDSGTEFSFVLGPVYTALRNEFLKQTKGVLRVYEDPDFVFQGVMDLCYRVEKSRVGLVLPVLPVLPSVSMMFRGAEMVVSGEKLLVKSGLTTGNDDIHCFTFGNSDLLGIEAYVIGHHHQQNMWMEFDLRNNRVGFAEVRCDSASQKLGVDL